MEEVIESIKSLILALSKDIQLAEATQISEQIRDSVLALVETAQTTAKSVSNNDDRVLLISRAVNLKETAEKLVQSSKNSKDQTLIYSKALVDQVCFLVLFEDKVRVDNLEHIKEVFISSLTKVSVADEVQSNQKEFIKLAKGCLEVTKAGVFYDKVLDLVISINEKMPLLFCNNSPIETQQKVQLCNEIIQISNEICATIKEEFIRILPKWKSYLSDSDFPKLQFSSKQDVVQKKSQNSQNRTSSPPSPLPQTNVSTTNGINLSIAIQISREIDSIIAVIKKKENENFSQIAVEHAKKSASLMQELLQQAAKELEKSKGGSHLKIEQAMNLVKGTLPKLLQTTSTVLRNPNNSELVSNLESIASESKKLSADLFAIILTPPAIQQQTTKPELICGKCSKPINSMISKRVVKGIPYHPECFKCSKCEKIIEDSAVFVDGKPYHNKRECWSKDNKKCSACGESISGTCLSILGKSFHQGKCWRCFRCEKPFADNEFLEFENNPYCNQCYEILTKPKQQEQQPVQEPKQEIQQIQQQYIIIPQIPQPPQQQQQQQQTVMFIPSQIQQFIQQVIQPQEETPPKRPPKPVQTTTIQQQPAIIPVKPQQQQEEPPKRPPKPVNLTQQQGKPLPKLPAAQQSKMIITKNSTKEEVCKWLDSIGLSSLQQIFLTNQIDGRALFEITENDLKDIGITVLGQRRSLQSAIKELQATQ